MGIWAAGLARIIYPDITKFIADGGYRKTFIKATKFEVITPRWIVERTFAWLNNSRRLSKNYEYSIESAETMVKLSHIHTLLKRL